MTSTKRIFDLVVSISIFLSTLPLMIIIGLAIFLTMGSPILFIQTRPGLAGAAFKLIKFRSMSNVKDKRGNLLCDASRITKVGCLIRSLSLDELPSLWNVMKGDMSLVGPRPLLMEYLPLYSHDQARRHDVLPGITGWAQVNGRNAISWEEKFKYDVWYVENQSLWLDTKIIWITIKKVIAREGISANGEATMPKFTGNKE